jgi:oligoribonuclease (3'-5' exoribonuclease)
MFVWIDLEMTGLNTETGACVGLIIKDVILEVACIITDSV